MASGRWLCFFAIAAAGGYSDVQAAIRPVYPFMTAALIYSLFARAGMFSLLDVIGCISWVSSGRRRTRREPLLEIPGIKIGADLQRLRTPRKIGVILAGEGGKGAYQIGCWKAMRKHGLSFHAVLGNPGLVLSMVIVCHG